MPDQGSIVKPSIGDRAKCKVWSDMYAGSVSFGIVRGLLGNFLTASIFDNQLFVGSPQIHSIARDVAVRDGLAVTGVASSWTLELFIVNCHVPLLVVVRTLLKS